MSEETMVEDAIRISEGSGSEADILAQYSTPLVRSYWNEYKLWRNGKRQTKPDVNEDIATYWKVQSQLRAERKERENRELYEYMSELHHNRHDPNPKADFWTSGDMAEYFGVSRATILNWRAKGWVTAFRPNGPNSWWCFDADFIKSEVKASRDLLEMEYRRFAPRLLHKAGVHQGRQS